MAVAAGTELEEPACNRNRTGKNKTPNANNEKGWKVNGMWVAMLEVGSIFFGLTSTLCLMIALYMRANS